MRATHRVVVVVTLLTLIIAACGGSSSGKVLTAGTATPVPAPLTAPTPGVAADVLAGRLFVEVANGEAGRNPVVGTATVEAALATALEGLSGTTREQVLALFGAADPAPIRTDVADLLRRLPTDVAARKDRLRFAAAMWADEGAVAPTFLESLRPYDAGLHLAPFASDPGAARKAVNRWTRDQTDGKIDELIRTDPPRDGGILVSAMALDAKWKTPFQPERTRPGPFMRSDGTSVQVPLMQPAYGSREVPYQAGTDYRAVAIPYRSGLELVAVIPKAVTEGAVRPVSDLHPRLADGSLLRELGRFDQTASLYSVPRFSASTHVELAPALSAVGAPALFEVSGDFAGIGAFQRFRSVEHATQIDLAEEGTKVVSASGMVAEPVSGPTNPVSLDRPFLYVLWERATHHVLAIGQVDDPSVKPS